MSTKAARTLEASGQTSALAPRRPAAFLARLLAATVVAALLAPAATYALDPATTTVVASSGTALAGAPVTYTIRVTAPVGSPVPTGAVTLLDGATTIGGCSLSSGTCTVVTNSLSVGTHAIGAAYAGDAAHDPSVTAQPVLQAITAGVRSTRTAATTVSGGATSLAVALPAGATTGDVLVAAITVTGGSGTTITANGWTRLAGSDITSGTLLRQGLYYRVRAAGDPSTFTFSFSTTQRASAVIAAVAGADTSLGPWSAGAAYASATSFTLPAVSFATRVTGVALGFLGVGVGTTLGAVTNGYTTLGSIAASGGKTASQTTTGAAQRALTDATSVTGAVMAMGAAAVGLGQTVVVPAVPAVTVTRILTAPSTATFGTASTWSVRVDPTTATGSVAFLVDGVASGTTCALVGGLCTANLPLAAGQRTVAARYVPTPTFLQASTSSSVAVAVARAASATTLTLLAPSVARGSVATFRIAVAGGASSTAGTGTVRVLEGGTEVASCVLAAGTCDATTATLSVGAHPLSAAFDGDGNLEPSASVGTLIQTVVKAASATTLAVSAASAPYGGAVTMTATVTSGAGPGTGRVAFSDGTLPVAGCTLGSGGTPGTCAVTVTTLAIGAHSLVARYGGDADRLESTSGTQAVTIAKATSTLAISSTPANPTIGTTVTLRASVTTGDGSVASGTISFTEGIAVLGTCALGSGGTAGACSVDVTSFSVGNHTIGIAYGGDVLHQPATATYVQSIGRAPTVTSVASSLNPAYYGSSVSFVATVTSGAGSPTGTVAVSDGTAPLGTCTLSSGSCTVVAPALAVGGHTIIVSYLGDALRAPSSTGLPQSIVRALTATTLGVAGTLTYGSPITLTATVDRTAATGTVSFGDGGTSLGTCALGSGGTAGRCSITTTALAAGTRSIVATYLGDANYASSASAAATPTIARAGTVLSLGSAGGTTYGSAIVFTATLDRTAATGTISFSDGTTGIGSCTVGTLAPGRCSISIATLAVGDHSVTARYAGDASFAPTTSPAVVLAIVPGPSTTTLVAGASGILVNEATQLTASVSPATATGIVEIRDGTATVGQCTLSGGACSTTITFADRGTRSLVAVYGGDTNLASSASSAVSLVVRATSTTTLATDVASSTYGQAVTLTATVAGVDGGTPTGRVAFSDGTTGIGSCDLAGGTSCSLSVASIPAGSRSLVARYGGDGGYAASAGTASLAVVEATTATTVTSSAASAQALTAVTFTVAVTTADGSPATGLVAVSDGTTPLATCRISGGSCTVTTDALAVGAHTINATYLGDPNHSGSTASLAQTIVAIATTVAATASPTSAPYGTAVTLTVTVTPSAATGNVTFTESGTTYGSCSILASSPGTCSLTTSTIPVGARSITARYGGDSRYAAGNATVAVTIVRAASTTTLTSSASPSTYGTAVTFTASVTPSVATGTVSFLDGTAGIGTCSLVAGSNGVCSLTTSTLTAGTHGIVARFGGSTNLAESSAGITQSVTAAPTSLTFTPSANPSTRGAGTATISISPAAATGTVTVTDNGAAFVSCTLVSGACSISLASLSLGAHTLVATYGGAANYGATSATIVQSVSIGYRAVATATAGSKAATSLAITMPAAATTGDVLVAAVTITGTATITPAAGWTRLGTDVTSATVSQGIFWKAATSGDIGATATFGYSASVKSEIVLIALGGAAATGPSAFLAQQNVAATSIATPALTLPASTRGIAVVFGGIATGTTVASVTGFTFPAGAETATNGGQAQTTTAAAYSAASTYASVSAGSIATAASTGAVSIGHVVFVPQAATP